ncbi:MAG: MazG nucleotide pyrophosphohydrolase domain-containing protein [Methanobacteriota archaeon]
MRVAEFQTLIRDLYFERDRDRGVVGTYLWLADETGDLSTAIRRKKKERVEEELADVMSWAASLANLYGIDLEKALAKKFESACPACHERPCACHAIMVGGAKNGNGARRR